MRRNAGFPSAGTLVSFDRNIQGSIPRYIWPWMRMVCRSEWLLQTVPVLTARRPGTLIEDITAEHLLAGKGYDSDAIVEQAQQQGMQAQIPPRKNRKEPRSYDKHLYKLRHLVENVFLNLKRWRGIAARYAKNAASFLAAVQIRCLALWLNVS
jgi:transposase